MASATLALCGLPVSRAVGQDLHDFTASSDGVSETHVEYHEVKLPAGKEVVLGDLKGPGKITYWYITDDTGGKFYPGLVLKIFWDGDAQPSVNVPLSDFFGAIGGHTIDYQSAPMQIEHLCYMCYLPMPFSQHARFVWPTTATKTIGRAWRRGSTTNRASVRPGEKPAVLCVAAKQPDQGRHAHDPGRPRPRPLRGELLAGLHQVRRLVGRGRHDLPPRRQKITHTPGTEDEYGACWGFGNTYSYLYSGYLQNEKGDNRMYRWYLPNPVRFRESLKVEIQNQHDNGTPTTTDADDYTSIAYWYQESPQSGRLAATLRGTHRPEQEPGERSK